MGGTELGNLWDYKQQQAAQTAAGAEEARRVRETMRARKEAALAKAEAILASMGSSIVDDGRVGQCRMAYIPMGQITGAPEGTRGYASVYVTNDTELEEVITKGRFFKKSELVRVVTERVSNFGVTFSAAADDSAKHEVLQYSDWSIVNQGFESDADMAQLEGALELVAIQIGLSSSTETAE